MSAVCKVDGCERPVRSRGWCGMHDQRVRKHGAPGPAESTNHRPCRVEGCEELSIGRELCAAHYRRWWKYGNELAGQRTKTPRPEECTEDGCAAPVLARGLCHVHYNELRAEEHRPCTVRGCARPVLTDRGGLCAMHETRVRRHGTTGPATAHRRRNRGSVCERAGCEREARVLGLCTVHYAGTQLRRRRARKANAAGSHTRSEWLELLEMYEGRCAYCETEPATSEDHIRPLSRGGSDWIWNILPACRSCNSSKNGRLNSEWVDRRRK